MLLNKIDLDKPDELLESDSKYTKGQNPMIGDDSRANK
jgi:glycerol-3-phosphate dehydrogenase